MELRILMVLLRVLDPRLWRRRLAQLTGLGVFATWITARSIASTDEVRAVRDARHLRRAERIARTLARREAEVLGVRRSPARTAPASPPSSAPADD